MSDWINSAIAAGAALAGSGLTALVTSRAARRHAEGQERSELVAALQAYGYAVSTLAREIEQLPPAPELDDRRPVGSLAASAAARLGGRPDESPDAGPSDDARR